jgi:hypothetical protein
MVACCTVDLAYPKNISKPNSAEALNNSKQLNFEIRTESTEYRGSEKNGLSENNWTIVPVGQSRAQIGNGYGYWA